MRLNELRFAPPSGYALYNRGLALLAKGEIDRAIINQAIGMGPPNPLIYEGLGLAFLLQGQFDQAIADFDQALKPRPTLASALYGRGVAKLKKGENASGEAEVSAAKAIKPNVAEEFARYGLR